MLYHARHHFGFEMHLLTKIQIIYLLKTLSINICSCLLQLISGISRGCSVVRTASTGKPMMLSKPQVTINVTHRKIPFHEEGVEVYNMYIYFIFKLWPFVENRQHFYQKKIPVSNTKYGNRDILLIFFKLMIISSLTSIRVVSYVKTILTKIEVQGKRKIASNSLENHSYRMVQPAPIWVCFF